ncbi:hypothetical protein EVAR_11822_1 [Eumeta japonica]|uniref:Uncharacterized protein n=1 Tax=Eumeta variegata TaxID=151549 RepID=A0A4C1UPV2_EUMVA|nr:hypothetical protein EVAR_11822_1 [Eumeta japonica]
MCCYMVNRAANTSGLINGLILKSFAPSLGYFPTYLIRRSWTFLSHSGQRSLAALCPFDKIVYCVYLLKAIPTIRVGVAVIRNSARVCLPGSPSQSGPIYQVAAVTPSRSGRGVFAELRDAARELARCARPSFCHSRAAAAIR